MTLLSSSAGTCLTERAIELKRCFKRSETSPTLSINETVNRMWQAGQQVFHLGFGESRFAVHPMLRAALSDHGGAKSYPPARGIPPLLSAVAGYYSEHLQHPFNESQVIVGPGSKALIYAAQLALGGDLFLPAPSWVSYAPQAGMLNKSVHYIQSRVEDGYRLTPDALAAALAKTDGQKLLVINSPSNPTGTMCDDTLLAELADCCRQHNTIVLSDEIYFRVRGSQAHHSIVHHYPEGTIVLGGLSKHLSIGGWRLGVALLPATAAGGELMNALATIASEIWSGVAAPIQHAAVAAYQGHPEIEQYIETCSAIHRIRTRYLYDRLTALRIQCTAPQGAFYLTANFDRWRKGLERRNIKTSAQLAQHLLENFNIATLPCADFGLPPEVLSLRLASSYLDMEHDSDSDRLLSQYQSDSNPSTFMSQTHHPNFHACLEAFGEFIQSID